MLQTFYFSPSETTKTIVETLTAALGQTAMHHNLTVQPQAFTVDATDDVVLLAAPVYAGRVPLQAAERLANINGHGQKAIVVVVYGNRDYDDALLELCDIARKQGFVVIAAGAFIGQHCIFPRVAKNRPDEDDISHIAKFAEQINEALSKNSVLDHNSVKGKRPYKKIVGVPLHPKVDKKLCTSCATCARECPVGAIPKDNPKITEASRCITCCRCIQVCPQDARRLGGLIYKIAGWKFVKDNTRRLDPEWFI